MSDTCECVNKWSPTHVHPTGESNSPLQFVGEAPGEHEDREGKPFVGGSGRILGRWLYDSGLFRQEVRIDNVYCHRPPNNEIPREAKFEFAVRELWKRMGTPKVIVALGQTALDVFAPRDASIGNWRGSHWVWKNPMTGHHSHVVATLHPAFIMRQVAWWDLCVSDVKYAKSLIPKPAVERELEYYSNPSPEWFADWVSALKPDQPLSIDFETAEYPETEDILNGTLDGQNVSITQVALSAKHGSAICLDLEAQYMRSLLKLVRMPLRWIGQNIVMFDSIVSYYQFRNPLWKVFRDTMLMSHLVRSPGRHGLAHINARYTRYPYWKDLSGTQRHLYASLDADITLGCYEMMEHDLVRNGQVKLIEKVMRAAHHVRSMAMRGVPIDKALVGEAKDALEQDAAKVLAQLVNMTGDKWFNPRSSKQCQELLYGKLKLPKQYNRKGREMKVTTDDDALVKLSKLHEAPRLILAYRRPANDVSKYFRPDLVVGGKWYPDWKIHGTETGRYSCWFHTLPPRVRHIVRRENRVIVYADAQQGEFRIAVSRYCADDKKGQEVADSKFGVHVANACLLYSRLRGYKVAPEDVNAMMKFYAKFTTFGWLYGREAPSIAEQYGLELKAAQEVLDALNMTYGRVVIWKADTADFAKRHGYLVNPYGRRRYFPEGSDDEKEREAFNFIPQSTLHDVVQDAHSNVEETFPTEYIEVNADMHDALLCNACLEFEKGELLKVLNREYLPGLVMPFDCEVNPWWVDKRAEEDAKGKVIIG